MELAFTATQIKRLTELGCTENIKEMRFESPALREQKFKALEEARKKENRTKLDTLLKQKHQPALIGLRMSLENILCGAGFTQVATPVILSGSLLAKMTITPEHPLYKQLFWLDGEKNKCLRPMLAPNLYYVSKDLMRLAPMPLRIFEVGSCFRRESQGSSHLNEFTMLNLVEWGTPEAGRVERIKELAALVMEAVGVIDYRLEKTDCVVYGDTVDVKVAGIEVGSSSMGPHFLDEQWGVTCTWVGIGFGLERILMVRDGVRNIHSVGRSISYLDGVRLNI